MRNENTKHNRSVIATMTSYSNEKYHRIASKESRVSKKSQQLGVHQSKKKSSFTSFLSSSNKLKPNIL